MQQQPNAVSDDTLLLAPARVFNRNIEDIFQPSEVYVSIKVKALLHNWYPDRFGAKKSI